MNRTTRLFFSIALWCIALLASETLLFSAEVLHGPPLPNPSTNQKGMDQTVSLHVGTLTPAQEYAGEILAYLLRVVLGLEGRLESRPEWKIKGVDEDLNFDEIVEVMTDHRKNQLQLMVLDFNILDLTRTLYYYDERLSLYKGDFSVASIYPAPEFIAIRLLVLQKNHRNERIDLEALVNGPLLDPGLKPSSEDLNAMGLSPNELELIRDIIKREPRIYRYLKSPFLIKALYEVGAIRGGDFVTRKMGEANYKRYPCRPMDGSYRPDAVKILFLPSIMREFQYEKSGPRFPPYGFKATEFFKEMVKKLRDEILSATRAFLRGELVDQGETGPGLSQRQWEMLWTLIEGEYISFYIEDQRPLVVYPENASQVSRDVCPEADFSVILMGENIYKAIYFDRARDVYPAVDRLYVDMMDIKHSETEEETEKTARFICSRLMIRLPGLLQGLGMGDD